MTSVAARIQGSIPALITPMRGGKVDEQAFRKFVSWQIEQGSHGLVPCGTTGESPTLSHDEHMRVVEICVEENAGRGKARRVRRTPEGGLENLGDCSSCHRDFDIRCL